MWNSASLSILKTHFITCSRTFLGWHSLLFYCLFFIYWFYFFKKHNGILVAIPKKVTFKYFKIPLFCRLTVSTKQASSAAMWPGFVVSKVKRESNYYATMAHEPPPTVLHNNDSNLKSADAMKDAACRYFSPYFLVSHSPFYRAKPAQGDETCQHWKHKCFNARNTTVRHFCNQNVWNSSPLSTVLSWQNSLVCYIYTTYLITKTKYFLRCV